MSEPIYSVVASSSSVPAKELMFIKHATDLPLGAIKEKLSARTALATASVTDDEGLSRIKTIYDELSSAGVGARIYRRDKAEPYERFCNMLKTHAEIDSEDFPD
jgi:hypothetical protein